MNKTMKQRIVAAASLIGIFGSALHAYELRSPWVSERGPLSYIFETEKEDRYSLNIWHAMHCRSANKAFKAHGTATEPLTSLMFGKADFTLQEALPNSFADLQGEFYNRSLRTAVLHPRAQYNEKGITVGGRFEYPVYEDRGRIGVRASIPFRCIEIEREDWTGVADAEGLEDTHLNRYKKYDGTSKQAVTQIIRLDALESLHQSDDRNSFIKWNDGTTDKAVKMSTDVVSSADAASIDEDSKGVLLLYRKNSGALSISDQDSALRIIDPRIKPFILNQPLDEDSVYFFKKTEDYGLFADSANKTVSQRLKDQELKRHLWAIKTHGEDAPPAKDHTFKKFFDLELDRFLLEANEYVWLYDRGVDFKTERRTGLGDIDLDLFYEHRFTDEVLMEVMLGIRLPTGGSSHTAGNPYRPRLGNGSHAEVKLGAMVAYQPLAWMNMKLDMYYSFVIEGMEHRPAAFEGAQVRHLGPEADAKVDWGYFVGRLDFNFFHPETKSLSSMIGYEVFLKQQDHVRFRKIEMASWLGRKMVKGVATEELAKLDNAVAEKDTDAIGHKVRAEASYRVNKYLELFLGGCFTFAGKNLPAETDLHGGFRVQF